MCCATIAPKDTPMTKMGSLAKMKPMTKSLLSRKREGGFEEREREGDSLSRRLGHEQLQA